MHTALIGPVELRERGAGTAIFDCRFSLADYGLGRAQFRAGHIPGARHLDLERDLSGAKTATSGRHPLPTREAFERTLRSAGLDDVMEIVVYDDNRLAGAARAWWLMRYFGLTRVRVLDGGLRAWCAAGFPVHGGDPPAPRPGGVTLLPAREGLVVDRGTLARLAASAGAAIVDAREAARFAGREEPIDPVAGRIPGAVNLPWQQVTDEQGRVRPAPSLRALWDGLGAGDDPIVYCGSGVTASVVLLARTLAGLPGGRLYAGSWSEWCAHRDAPVERDT